MLDENHLASDLRQNLVRREVGGKESRVVVGSVRVVILGLRDLAEGSEGLSFPSVFVVVAGSGGSN